VLFFEEIKLQYSQNGQKLAVKRGQTNWGEIEDQLSIFSTVLNLAQGSIGCKEVQSLINSNNKDK